MKKMIILSVLILVIALAIPASAESFGDVPGDHWAYDAINQLVNAGVVEGYPDGEYKGQRSMSRFEMAVMVSRALDNIAEEQKAMVEGLNKDQAKYVIEIVRRLMEKNNNDTISEAQAAEVIEMVESLTVEYKSELRVLGADFDVLAKDVDELEAKVDILDVPEDNIEFGVTVDSIFETGTYDVEDEALAIFFFEDGDAYDDDAYYKKAFYQEIEVTATGDVAGADVSLTLDAGTNYFAATHYQNDIGEDFSLDNSTVSLDGALLEVAYNDIEIKIGDREDYHIAKYFVDEEDVEGLEITADYMDFDIKVFVLGSDEVGADDIIDEFGVTTTTDAEADAISDLTRAYGVENTTDWYGATVGKDLDIGTVTGKLFHVRKLPRFDASGNYINDTEVTVLAAELSDVALTDAVTMGAEVAFSDDSEADESDIYAMVNGEFAASDALTVTGVFEFVGEEFTAVADDLEASSIDYSKAEIGAEYMLDENNTVNSTFTYVMPGDYYLPDEEDEMTIEVALENVYGDFTNEASVEYTMNGGTPLGSFVEDTTLRVISLGTEYAWNESTTFGTGFTNKHWDFNDPEVSYNYLNGNVTKELNENISWETEAFYLIGEATDVETIDAEGHGMKTSLSVTF